MTEKVQVEVLPEPSVAVRVMTVVLAIAVPAVGDWLRLTEEQLSVAAALLV